MVRTWHFHCHGPGSIPGQGTKIPQAAQHGQKKKKGSLKRMTFIFTSSTKCVKIRHRLHISTSPSNEWKKQKHAAQETK